MASRKLFSVQEVLALAWFRNWIRYDYCCREFLHPMLISTEIFCMFLCFANCSVHYEMGYCSWQENDGMLSFKDYVNHVWCSKCSMLIMWWSYFLVFCLGGNNCVIICLIRSSESNYIFGEIGYLLYKMYLPLLILSLPIIWLIPSILSSVRHG